MKCFASTPLYQCTVMKSTFGFAAMNSCSHSLFSGLPAIAGPPMIFAFAAMRAQCVVLSGSAVSIWKGTGGRSCAVAPSVPPDSSARLKRSKACVAAGLRAQLLLAPATTPDGPAIFLVDVADLAKERTVILSTHILQEVEAMADRIVIISRGQIVGDGTIGELRARAKDSERFIVNLAGSRQDIERQLSSVGGIRRTEYEGENDGCHRFVLYSAPDTHLWREVSALAQAQQWQVREMGERPLSLEETFLKLTEKAGAAGAN